MTTTTLQRTPSAASSGGAARATEALDDRMVDLVQRAQAGDNTAFGEIYDEHVDQIHAFIHRKVGHRQTAEDLTSDVFVSAWRSIGRFEWQGRSLRAWLFTIARNRCTDHWKSARVQRERTVEATPEVVTTGESHPERIAQGRVLARRLGEALEALSDAHRQVIELRFIHEMTTQETADVLGRGYEATKQLQFRALKALQRECKSVPGLAEFAAAGISGMLTLLRMGL